MSAHMAFISRNNSCMFATVDEKIGILPDECWEDEDVIDAGEEEDVDADFLRAIFDCFLLAMLQINPLIASV